MSFLAATVARVRLLRGRCPSCASEGTAVASCRVCLGYEGPFPPSESTRRRWAGRAARAARAQARSSQRGVIHLSPVR